MRDVKREVMTDAPVKVKECLRLFSSFEVNHKCKMIMEEHDFTFVKKPLKVKALKYEAGNLVM
jgi:hypothetical protein